MSSASLTEAPGPGEEPAGDDDAGPRNAFLGSLGERVRTLRARRGLTRKTVSQLALVSERHLANLEHGTGNASILVLLQIARALECPLAELLGDVTTSSPEWLLIRELLESKSEAQLHQARQVLAEQFGDSGGDGARRRRIALIGLRGAGKSTLGQMLADDLDYPFIELSREIEKIAGCDIAEIINLYGTLAYRRYERKALETAIRDFPEAVIATPGGVVSDSATFNALLAHCFAVWLQADPEDHMQRVMRQGDLRPMAASSEAMADLRRILVSRSAFYGKADLSFNTSGRELGPTFAELRRAVRGALALPE